jgi:hypothetical protein
MNQPLTDERIESMIKWNRAVFDHRNTEALEELLRLRAMERRLEELALSLEHNWNPDMRKVGAELRNRMGKP